MNKLLAEAPIFAGLNEKAREAFLGHAKRIEAPAGEVIAREGETNECLFLIEGGEVSIIKHHSSPHPTTLAVLGPGQCFGEMCVLETQPRSATGMATRDSTVLQIPSTAFFKLYKHEPEQYCVVLLNIARDLSKRLRQLDEAFASRA